MESTTVPLHLNLTGSLIIDLCDATNRRNRIRSSTYPFKCNRKIRKRPRRAAERCVHTKRMQGRPSSIFCSHLQRSSSSILVPNYTATWTDGTVQRKPRTTKLTKHSMSTHAPRSFSQNHFCLDFLGVAAKTTLRASTRFLALSSLS